MEGATRARRSAFVAPYAVRGWVSISLLAAAFSSLYLLLLPGNRSETDDGFGYSYQVRTVTWDWQFDPHHALLIPIGKLISGFIDPYATLVGLSLVLGVASIMLFFWTLVSLGCSQQWALLGATFLAASFGFWRYAVEAETYTIATGTSLLLVLGTLRRWWLPWLLGFASLALLAHLINLAVVLVAGPAILWRRRELVRLSWYLAAAIPASVALILAALGSGPPAQPPVVQDVLRLPIGIGQSVVAANALLGLPGAEVAVSRLFPGRDLTAEAAIAHAAAGPLAWAGALTLCVLLAAAVGLLVSIVRADGRAQVLGLWLFASWLACYALPAMMQERGNPEMWIVATVPLWGVLVALGQRCGPRPPRSALVLAVALTLHTVVAGLLPVQSLDDDVNYRSTRYLREHAPSGSLVVTDDNQVLTRYLRYEVPVTVVNLNTQALPADLSPYPAVYVMPSAADRVPYVLVADGDVYRVVPEGHSP